MFALQFLQCLVMPNEIIEIYRGIKVRTYNQIILRVSQYEFKKFIDFKLDSRLSARDVIEATGQPCQCCKGSSVIAYNNRDESVEIKRGLLTKKKK